MSIRMSSIKIVQAHRNNLPKVIELQGPDPRSIAFPPNHTPYRAGFPPNVLIRDRNTECPLELCRAYNQPCQHTRECRGYTGAGGYTGPGGSARW